MIDTMLQNPHISEYMLSLESDLSDELEALREYGEANHVPIIRREAQALIRFLFAMQQPTRILEVGTAIGFSACVMSELAPKATITTIEKVTARIEEAKETFRRLDKQQITLLEGDAIEVLAQLAEREQSFDFIFLDAAKAQYRSYFPYLKRMLVPGGVLLTDNVFQEGSLAESKFTVTRRNRTIHMRMREYMEELFHQEDMTSMLLPVGDGCAVTVKQRQIPEVAAKAAE